MKSGLRFGAAARPETRVTEEDKPTTSVPPYPLAMVVCDMIWRDSATGKSYLMGLFSNIRLAEFPSVFPMVAVHVALTDGHGKQKIRLRLVDVNEEREALFDRDGEVEFPDPMAVVELNIFVGSIRFEHAGEYRFQLYGGQALLMERRVFVVESSKRSPQ